MSIDFECPSCKAKHKIEISPLAKQLLEEIEKKLAEKTFKPEEWLKHAKECKECSELVRKYFPQEIVKTVIPKEEVKKENVRTFPF